MSPTWSKISGLSIRSIVLRVTGRLCPLQDEQSRCEPVLCSSTGKISDSAQQFISFVSADRRARFLRAPDRQHRLYVGGVHAHMPPSAGPESFGSLDYTGCVNTTRYV